MKLNRNDIEALVEKGYIMMNKHPELDLFILNYTKAAQFEKVWNEYTLMARGLVVDGDFNVVARPFPKFFNLEEHKPEEIPTDLSFEVFDKMDGSLGILFYYAGTWHLATRGSFTSDQAKKGAEILHWKYQVDNNMYDKLAQGFTYLFEIIYPENRIVVDYNGKKDLVLLAAIENATGNEMPYENLKYSGFDVVKKFTIDKVEDFKDLKLLNGDNREGFIVKFSNGFRVKIKYEEYCRLHRIVTNVSNKTVWEFLKDDKPFGELIDRVPDEFFDWVKETRSEMISQFERIEYIALKDFYTRYVKDFLRDKKGFALMVKGHPYESILFKMFDGKPYRQIIWKLIKPEFAKPFANDEN